ncbi:hypothetical protein L218DRAFT_963170 [Marasmius fiardii PR-910]|nr:hypothetical protein L218DRAFT_963170 [Marasmius fiardii PR-910]
MRHQRDYNLNDEELQCQLKQSRHRLRDCLEDKLYTCFPSLLRSSSLSIVSISLSLLPHRSPARQHHHAQDPERQRRDQWAAQEMQAASLLAIDWILWLYQSAMALGMGMVVVGYIGCFNLVGSSDGVKNGPYVWVGMEVFLSLIRIHLWGLNPDWDESIGIRARCGERLRIQKLWP